MDNKKKKNESANSGIGKKPEPKNRGNFQKRNGNQRSQRREEISDAKNEYGKVGAKAANNNQETEKPETGKGKQPTGLSYQMNGFSANKIVLGSTDYDVAFHVIYSALPELMINTPTVDDGILTAICSAYYSTRGYTPASPVTPAKIKSYLSTSLQYIAMLLVMKRYYDGRKLVSDTGVDISFIASRHVHTFGATVDNKLSKIAANTAATTITISDSDGNAVWNQDWLGPLSRLRLSPAHVAMMVWLFGGVHQIPGQSRAFDVYWPTLFNSSTDPSDIRDGLLTILDGVIATNPEITDILDRLNFTSLPGISLNWDRDIRGQVLNVVQCPDLTLINSQRHNIASANYFADVDVKDTYRLPLGQNMGNYQDQVIIKVEDVVDTTIFSNRLLTGAFDAAPYLTAIAGATTNDLHMMPSMGITLTGTDTDANKLTSWNRFSLAMRVYLAVYGLCPTIVPVSAALSVNTTLTVVVTGITADSYVKQDNDYYVGDDDNTILHPVLLTWMYGAEYRAKLQAVLAALTRVGTGV